MDKIPLERQVVYFGVAALLPLLFVAIYLFSSFGQLRSSLVEIDAIEQKLLTHHHRGMRNSLTRDRFRGADSMYLNKYLEPLPLLKRELTSLEDLIAHEPTLPNKEVVQRVEFLKESNSLAFAEGVVQTLGEIRETIERLVHPVEIDERDLHTLLTLIEGEGAPAERPQLLVTEFRLDRKESSLGSELFRLDMKLLKREYSTR